jgi:RNA polymerase sigma factor (sigma-70 family)
MDNTNPTRGTIDTQLLQIKQGDDRFLRNLYEAKRTGFVSWFQKNYTMNKQQACELFQKAFSIFYFNVKDGKIQTLKSSIDTYVFGIGKMIMKEQYRQESRVATLEEIPDVRLADYSIFHVEETTHQQNLVRKILDKLQEPCKSLLVMYYFKNFSLESIAENLGYKNPGVVKKKKCLCLKHVRSQLLKSKLED